MKSGPQVENPYLTDILYEKALMEKDSNTAILDY
jgi:hypothetical protein